LPSKGIGLAAIRSSCMILAQPASRVALSGHSNQQKTATSSPVASTARLKSVTGGQGTWSMQLSHYDPAPPALQQQLATEFQKHRKHEED